MTLKDCYQYIGNYEEAVSRLIKEDRITRYLAKFCDTTDFDAFLAALDKKDYPQAFLCIHNLKGLYLNLALTKAAQPASVLCELLRGGTPTEDLSEPLSLLVEAHTLTLQTIRRFLADPS